MAAPLEPRLVPGVLHDKDANPIDSTFSGGLRRLAVDATVTTSPPQPGTTITTPADVSLAPGATVSLPAIPSGTRRMTVQNTGPAGTLVRIREVGAGAGRGVILPRFGFAVYGGGDGAIAALEAEEIAGIATTVAVQFERN